MTRVLYLSHDGLLDPLGQSQILPYLVQLSGADTRIALLTFEKPHALRDVRAVEEARRCCADSGIRWVALTYHRQPSVVATLWDMARGFWTAWRLVRQERLQLVHARSYVAACLGVLLKRLAGTRLVFDMRELWVDGKVEGGAWPRGGWLHRLGKRCERWCLTQADAVVSLTEDGKRIVEGFSYWRPAPPPIAVIPTCVDVERFANHHERPAPRPAFLEGRRVIVYLGSIGSWYRFDAMVDCVREAAGRRLEVFFLVLTPHVEAARRLCAERGLAAGQYDVRSVPHQEVPAWLRWADVSLYFIHPSYAKRSSCPTKLGESLAAGLPILTNAGIGDQDDLIAARWSRRWRPRPISGPGRRWKRSGRKAGRSARVAGRRPASG
ncbi:MAG: glycosyltransferase [Candidatus Omnitrophica bacterium]|nr:glycosyltransferase [Candidatus Omnitrophota bacterium]